MCFFPGVSTRQRNGIESCHENTVIYSPDTNTFMVGLGLSFLGPEAHVFVLADTVQHSEQLYVNTDKLADAAPGNAALSAISREATCTILQSL